jgi:hypothetical protein
VQQVEQVFALYRHVTVALCLLLEYVVTLWHVAGIRPDHFLKKET